MWYSQSRGASSRWVLAMKGELVLHAEELVYR